MTRQQTAERHDAITKLREWIKPGDTVYTILDNVSRSGMSRAIRVLIPTKYTTDSDPDSERIDFIHPNWAVGKALGLRHWKRNGREQDALVVGGCGMDMGFHLVYTLSHVLYGDGYACLGKGKCPSNYHVNHRDWLRCDGFGGRMCWKPDLWSSRFPVPENWPTGEPIDIGDGATIPGPLLACLHNDDETAPREVCPTCKGRGEVANPDGPERFDLTHTDGYALRHKWL